MKHEAWRRDAQRYTAVFDLEPRWTDVDTLRHLNNSALHGLHQEARMRFLAAHIGDGFWRRRGPRLLARRVVTDFLLQSHYPEPLQAAVSVTAIGERQLVLGSGLFQGGHCVGLQSTTLVAHEGAAAIPMPGDWQQALDAPMPPPAPAPAAEPGTPPVLQALAHRRTLDSRYADLDATGRTSELAWMRGAESGRAGLLRSAFAALGSDAERAWLGLLVARVDLHVLHPRPAPPQWRLGAGVSHLGRSSVVVRVGFFDEATVCAAFADCVQVFVDRERGTPVPMPEPVRQVLERCRVHPATAP